MERGGVGDVVEGAAEDEVISNLIVLVGAPFSDGEAGDEEQSGPGEEEAYAP